MIRKVALLAMVIATAAISSSDSTATASSVVADSLGVRRDAEDSVRAFVLRWRQAWESDNLLVREEDPLLGAKRMAYAHCHAPAPQPDDYTVQISRNFPIITGASSLASMCPSWILGKLPVDPDSDESVDGALTSLHRDTVRTARVVLLRYLEQAAQTLPADGWITGQRVRFLVDQGNAHEALKVAQGCRDARWLCSALVGYALHAARDFERADSAFLAASRALPTDFKCDWIDVRQLLPARARKEYSSFNCAVQDSISARYWWLADPMYSIPGNERRAEHYARRVLVMLHEALDEDERFHWVAAFGGEAVSEMLLRYGWPTSAIWIGTPEDRNHTRYLEGGHSHGFGPYATAEYAPTRVHFGAEWRAVVQPFAAGSNAWQLTVPPDERTAPNGRGDFWWPAEHSRAYGRTLLQYPDGQVALFRRQGGVRVAAAIDLTNAIVTAFRNSNARDVTTTLIASPSPDSIVILSQGSVPLGTRVHASGTVSSGSVILGVESVSGTLSGNDGASAVGQVWARTRFGTVLPPPLDSLKDGAIAISEPVLFSAADTTTLPADVDELLPRMLGRTTTKRAEKVGVFWESYGIVGGDHVQFAVNVISTSGRSFMQRLASALRLSNGAPGNVEVSWADLHRDGDGVGRDGPTVLPRSIVLGLAALPKGDYTIEVVVTVRGKDPVRAQRALAIN